MGLHIRGSEIRARGFFLTRPDWKSHEKVTSLILPLWRIYPHACTMQSTSSSERLSRASPPSISPSHLSQFLAHAPTISRMIETWPCERDIWKGKDGRLYTEGKSNSARFYEMYVLADGAWKKQLRSEFYCSNCNADEEEETRRGTRFYDHRKFASDFSRDAVYRERLIFRGREILCVCSLPFLWGPNFMHSVIRLLRVA